MSDKKRFNKPGSLQPNIEDILQWNDLPADAFDPATSEEKENFMARYNANKEKIWKEELKVDTEILPKQEQIQNGEQKEREEETR